MNDTLNDPPHAIRLGRALLNIVGLVGACAVMGVSMRQEAAATRAPAGASPAAIAAATAATPSDFGAMPPSSCRVCLGELLREYDRTTRAAADHALARADYNALVVQAPAPVLHVARLPARLL